MCRVSGFGFWDLVFGVWVWVSCVGFGVSGFGIWGLVFVFRVLVVWFRVSGLGFRV